VLRVPPNNSWTRAAGRLNCGFRIANCGFDSRRRVNSDVNQHVSELARRFDMRRSTYAVLFLIVFLSANCNQQIVGIAGSISQGMIYHDVLLTNNSRTDLHECNLNIITIGETGERPSEPRYFAVWPKGQKQTVLPSEKSPKNVQKVSVVGACKEGRIDLTWVPKANQP